MKTITHLCYLLIFFSPYAHSQLGEGTFLGQIEASSLAIGGSMMDFSLIDSTQISLHYRRPYSLNALSSAGIELLLPFRPMLVNASFLQMGDDLLQEQSLQVHLKKKTSKTIWIKVGCGFYRLHAINGITGKSVYADLNIVYLINPAIAVGCRLVNPTGSTVNIHGERKKIEQINLIGLTYNPATSMTFILEGEERPGLSPLARLGLLYTLDQAFTIMGGVSTSPIRFAWGVRTTLKRTSIILGLGLHPQLGLTSALSCSYHFRWKQ